MNTVTVHARSQGPFSPYMIAVPFAMIIFGFYGTFMPFGLLSIFGFAVVGLLWALFLGFIAKRLMSRETWRERLANASLFVSIIAIGLMLGGGFMYGSMMNAVVEEPSTTYDLLSALMQPAIPYYIIINTPLELFIMLLVVFFNWNVDPKRRIFSLIGVGLYLVMRVWTYLVFAETRLDISMHTLSAADVEWFKQTLATDYRGILELISQGFFILAAMIPARSTRDKERRRPE
jgi:hypothetical protein